MNITNIALSGMESARKRLNSSATKIANANCCSQDSQADSTDAVQVELSKDAKNSTDTLSELINLKIASYDYQANAKVLKIADDLQEKLLDILA